MNTLLSIPLPTTFEETLILGAQVVLIGIATVFSVLILIMGILSVFKLFIGGNKKEETKPISTEAPTAAPVQPSVVTAASNDDIIVAVIAAAIAMAENESVGGKFRVVSFRRK